MDQKRSKRAYSPQFRAEAVQLVVVSGRPITHVAKELGIVDQILGVWVTQPSATSHHSKPTGQQNRTTPTRP